MTLGDPVSLECRIVGTPKIGARWSKDGRDLLSSRHYQHHYEDNFSKLKIHSSQLGDAGEYMFEATNSVGSCRCKVKLLVVGQ